MTPDLLLDELLARGVELTPEPPQLRLNAPAGVLTPELKAEITANKADLLALLVARPDVQGVAATAGPKALTPTQIAAAAAAWVSAGCPKRVPIWRSD